MRQSRLRQFLHHERWSVAMALAESQHHTLRGQRFQGPGRGRSRDALHGHVPDASSSPGGRPCSIQWTWLTCLPPGDPGLNGSPRSGRRSGWSRPLMLSPRCVNGEGECTGGCRVRSTPLGTSPRDGPPAQGGIQILGKTDAGRSGLRLWMSL